MTRLAHNSFIAALLPFSFLWTVLACVSICERDCSAIQRQTTVSYSTVINEVRDLPDCVGCPLSFFPKATAPERVKYVHSLTPITSLAAAPPIAYLNHTTSRGWSPGQFSTESPPLDRLPA